MAEKKIPSGNPTENMVESLRYCRDVVDTIEKLGFTKLQKLHLEALWTIASALIFHNFLQLNREDLNSVTADLRGLLQ